MTHIASIAYTPEHIERKPRDRYGRLAVERATLRADFGIDGDAKGQAGDRQLNVILSESVEGLKADGFQTAPGELGEQLVIAGLMPLMLGARLRLGASAIIEIASIRKPCDRLAHIQGHAKEEAIGRIGYMARVITGGPIAVGDSVTPV